METATEARRRQRGTKRVCRSCEQRFYDLAKDPVICPLCQSSLALAEYEQPRVSQHSGYSGSGWHSRKKPDLPVVAIEEENPPIADDADDTATDDKDASSPAVDDDTMLEQDEELDDDVNDLLSPDDADIPED